ncbi:LysR family transcriptional regulator [Ramlibacter sp.]|uniref:LysR family transcriptional regulator n=1 Tax=Ramlibacter sp. TaxID=1917967 RepID=UPI0017FC5ABC|nr:LysR family transcriptional regulator [Ramlibacter sp.]MBA2673335.1 LysR family transcriptional regulator [Ramlibacter sp.]
MNIKLRRVEVFMAVVEAGGFSAAANQLHIAQSAVSVAIRELERELGTQLFVRGRRSVELTESGGLLLERAQPALRQLYGIRAEIRDVETMAMGHVRVGAPAMVTQFALRHVLPSFMAKFPGVRLHLRQAGALEIEQMVLRGEIDLGVISYREAMPQLESLPVWDFQNIACLPQGAVAPGAQRIGWAALLRHPQAVYPEGYHQRALVEKYAAQLGIPLKIAIESENPGLLVAAVKAGLAATTLPAAAIEGEQGVARLKLPEQEGDRLKVGLCWRKDHALSRAARGLLEHLRDDRSIAKRRRPPSV